MMIEQERERFARELLRAAVLYEFVSTPLPEPEPERKDIPGCGGCLFLARQDTGYSNYTVEDTELWCLKGCNPHMIDPKTFATESVELAQALDHGLTCVQRVVGDGPWYDVDGETNDETYRHNELLYEQIKTWRVADMLRRGD